MFDIEVSRFYLVTCIKISHLKRSRTLFFNRVIGNAHGGGIIDMDWGGRLRWPISANASLMILPSFMFMNSAPNSASAADDATIFRIVLRV